MLKDLYLLLIDAFLLVSDWTLSMVVDDISPLVILFWWFFQGLRHFF